MNDCFNCVIFSENTYTVLHYCLRNLVELNSADTLISLPIKDSQGRNLLFMTLLENQDDKTVEFVWRIDMKLFVCFEMFVFFS